MHVRSALSVLAVLPSLLAAQANNPFKHEPRPTTSAITPADLMTRLYIFADDSMEGRESGTRGNIRGTDYIARELERLGLVPAGDQGTWFQDFPLEEIRLDPATVMSVDGQTLEAGKDFLMFPPIPQLGGLGAAFSAENTPVVYGGQIGDLANASPDAVAGKLMLMAPADGPAGWQFWARFGPTQWQRYASAKGIIVVALDSLPDPVRGFLAGGAVSMPDTSGFRPRFPVMYVTREVAERMMGGTLTGVLPGTEGKTATALGGFVKRPTEVPGRNVVAIVPGTDPSLRNQYVAFGAHNDHDGIHGPGEEHDSLRAYNTIVRPEGAEDMGKVGTEAQRDSVRVILDSLRRLRPARIDSVMNGADDDGSGSMALLELAEYFVSHPAKRSLVFVWHTAEEKGLFGSEWYSDHPTVPRDSIVAQLNMDMIGRGTAADIKNGGPGYLQLIGSRRLSTELGDLVDAVNLTGKHGFTFDYQYDANGHPQQYYCRSDHYNYARYGIPIVFFSTGSHRDYHMVTDEPQYIDYDKYAAVVNLVMDVGRAVANRAERVLVDQPRPDPRGQCVQ
jgi:hypothetical protein